MNFFILILFLCYFIFLFALHFLSRDDFILLRKDVSLDSLFNIAFVMVPLSLLFSRLLFVITNPSGNFLNPLYFLLFPYFPGLSLVGGVLGTSIFLFFAFKFKKMPIERLLDLFALSFLSCMPIGVIGYFLLSGANFNSLQVLFTIFSYIFLFIFFSFFLLPRFLKGRVGEGSMSIIFIIAFSIISIMTKLFAGKFSLGIENIFLVLTLVISVTFFVSKEKLISKIKFLNKK